MGNIIGNYSGLYVIVESVRERASLVGSRIVLLVIMLLYPYLISSLCVFMQH